MYGLLRTDCGLEELASALVKRTSVAHAQSQLRVIKTTADPAPQRWSMYSVHTVHILVSRVLAHSVSKEQSGVSVSALDDALLENMIQCVS